METYDELYQESLDDEDLFVYNDESDEDRYSSESCRYGCGKEATETFGTCGDNECMLIFAHDYPESRMVI